MTQRALADLLKQFKINLDQAAIARMEKGEREPKLSEAQAISKIFGFNIGEVSEGGDATLTRLRLLVDQLRDHRARWVAEELRCRNMLSEIEALLEGSPELEQELSERDRETVRRMHEHNE